MTVRGHLALIGDHGMLARAVGQIAGGRYSVTGFDLPGFDLTNRESVLRTLGELAPTVIVNCAAYTDVDGCESHKELAARVNGAGPGYLAVAARECGATLVHFSTDYVFDGNKSTPHREEDATGPRSSYGRSKLAGEQAVLESGLEDFFIVRTSWLYGSGGKNFVETVIRLAREREELRVVADQVGSPTYTEDLAGAVMNLLSLENQSRGTHRESSIYGLYHFANGGTCSWHGFATAIVEELAKWEPVKVRQVLPITTAEYPLPAERPTYSVLSTRKYVTATGANIPDWREALQRYFRTRS